MKREPEIKIKLTAFDGTDREVLPGDDTVSMWATYADHEVFVMPDGRGFHLQIEEKGAGDKQVLNISVEPDGIRVWNAHTCAQPLVVTRPMGGFVDVRKRPKN